MVVDAPFIGRCRRCKAGRTFQYLDLNGRIGCVVCGAPPIFQAGEQVLPLYQYPNYTGAAGEVSS